MKMSVRILLAALCLAFILCMPFVLSSGAMLGSVQWELMEDMENTEEADEGAFFSLFPSACAEENVSYKLPVDFSAGMELNPASYTQDGYQDDSITVKMETIEEDGVKWRVAHVEIKDASQLRTATAGKLTSSKTALPSSMAEAKNAVVAMSADYFSNDPVKTSFEYRQGKKIRAKTNRKKDILIIDENGDFHTFVKSDKERMEAFEESGHEIVNAFTFGPALVQDEIKLTCDTEYGYNPNGKEPRAAIGQTGPLSYVFVIAEGRTKESEGVTHQELADFMFEIGCKEAFNLDGGNSATLVFKGELYMDKSMSQERPQSDIIYFASAVDPESWQ